MSNAKSNLVTLFNKSIGEIARALPKHLDAERMSRLALTQFSQNKALQECDPVSILSSVIIASQLGLEPGITGQGYLVPYKGKCQFIPGWQGITDLVTRSGRASVWTGAVFEGDEFEWQLGDSPFVKHKPMNLSDNLTHVYAVGRVKGSDWPVIDVWTIDAVRKHRDKYNKVGRSHYSFGNEEMYARKIPLLQVAKYMPKTVEISQAMEASYKTETGGYSDFINGEATIVPDESDSKGVENLSPLPVKSVSSITESQASLLIKKMSSAGLEHDLFCNHFGIDSISDLEITKMNDAIGFIEAFAK
jgi:recombination protein RecT